MGQTALGSNQKGRWQNGGDNDNNWANKGKNVGDSGKNGRDDGKNWGAKSGISHQASHDFFWVGGAKLQSPPGADNPLYAARGLL